MKIPVFPAILVNLVLFSLTPPSALADIRIELKNGMSITAEECRRSETVLTCNKMGGTFEIESKDVVRVSRISGRGSDYEPLTSLPAGKSDEKVKEEPVAASRSQPAASGKRVEEIRSRKAELGKEREALIKEREELQQEVKKAADWMTVQQYDDLNKKSSDFDARLKKFNDEVKALNEEEKGMREKPDSKAASERAPQ